METEDLVGAALGFLGGAVGTINATTTAYPGYAERIELIYERGTAFIEGGRLIVTEHSGQREELLPDEESGGTGADPMAFPHTQHRALLSDFLDAIAADRDPPITGEEALKVHVLIDALLGSAANRRFVRLEPDAASEAGRPQVRLRETHTSSVPSVGGRE
jgi:UDP-N-acetyl-2-amino-2-deoxyglucuronate dehydrogenase